jgi:hypothetical protein
VTFREAAASVAVRRRTPDAIEPAHTQLDALWEDAPLVPDRDRLTFAAAVIEVACNVVQHAVPDSAAPRNWVADVCITEAGLSARVPGSGVPAFPLRRGGVGRRCASVHSAMSRPRAAATSYSSHSMQYA